MDMADMPLHATRRITRRRMLQGVAGATMGLALTRELPGSTLVHDTAQAAPASAIVWAWLANTDPPSLASLQQHAGSITHLSPTWYSMRPDLSIAGEVDQMVVHFAASHNIALHPLISNHGFDPAVAEQILQTPQRRAAAAQRIASLVLSNNFAGINVDFEGTFGASRDQYSDFVERLVRLLRPAGKWVTVDVVATTKPVSDASSTSWAAPYDYARLGAAANAVMLMAYDYSVQQPGPISPLWWVQESVHYARTLVPAQKLVVGLPFYGRHWIQTSSGITETGLSGTDALTLRSWSNARLLRPLPDATPRFSWRDGSQQHVVHFDDAVSLAAKLRVVGNAPAGVAFWRLGMDDVGHWPAIQTWLRTERQ